MEITRISFLFPENRKLNTKQWADISNETTLVCHVVKISDARAAPSGDEYEYDEYPHQDEGDVEHAGEAAHPPEAHHAEDGDHLRGRRVRRPCELQGQDVAEVDSA